MITQFLSLFFYAQAAVSVPYPCGHIETIKRSYGKVELRVDCESKTDYNRITVVEYKLGEQHGFQIDYDSLWRKRDSSFFVNGKEEGLCLYWDTLGNIVGSENYRKGRFVGTREYYFSPGLPSMIKQYNSQGKEDGPWKEWWKNGNKKVDLIAKNGDIVSGTEFYLDGKPRIVFEVKPLRKSESLLNRHYIRGEAWSPTGKHTGKIINGNGEWTVFSAKPDTATGQHNAYREVYKEGIMVVGEKLDSAEMAKWLK